MQRRGIGDFSKLSLRTIATVEAMQGLAVDHIRESFKTEDTSLRLDDLTLGDFIKALVEADENGTREQFEADLAAQISPLLDQLFAPQQPEQGGMQ